MRQADPAPVPPHLSDEERALWETPERCVFERATVRALLTALSSEREAGEKRATDAARAGWIAAIRESCPAWAQLGSCESCMERAVKLYPLASSAAPSTETPHA